MAVARMLPTTLSSARRRWWRYCNEANRGWRCFALVSRRPLWSLHDPFRPSCNNSSPSRATKVLWTARSRAWKASWCNKCRRHTNAWMLVVVFDFHNPAALVAILGIECSNPWCRVFASRHKTPSKTARKCPHCEQGGAKAGWSQGPCFAMSSAMRERNKPVPA